MSGTPNWLTLDPGEQVVWTGKPRTRRILDTVAVAVVLVVVAVAAAYAVSTGVGGLDPGPDVVLGVYAVAALLVGGSVLQVLVAYLRVRNTDYVLTDENVYRKTGIVSERVTRVGVGMIQNVEFTQDFTGKIFGYGTIDLSTAGSEGTELSVADLDDTDEFRRALNERMRRVDAVGVAGRPSRSGTPGVDPETLEAAVDEAERMREAALRIERRLTVDREGGD